MKLVQVFIGCIAMGTATASTLTVEVKGVDNDDGHVRIELAGSEAAWNGQAQAVAAREEKAGKGTMVLVFEDLAEGTYALRMYHDENDNNQLDSNILGIPTEGYAFSNNAGGFGPASWEDAAFDITEDETRIEVKMR